MTNEVTPISPEVRISPETQRRLKKELGFIDELATPKTSGRINAFNNIRIHLSLYSLMYYLQNSVTRCNYHSVDDVSVLLNSMGGKPENCRNVISLYLRWKVLRNRE